MPLILINMLTKLIQVYVGTYLRRLYIPKEASQQSHPDHVQISVIFFGIEDRIKVPIVNCLLKHSWRIDGIFVYITSLLGS